MTAHPASKPGAALVARHLCEWFKGTQAKGELWAVPPCTDCGAEYELRVVEFTDGMERVRRRICLFSALEQCPVCQGPMDAGPPRAA